MDPISTKYSKNSSTGKQHIVRIYVFGTSAAPPTSKENSYTQENVERETHVL